MDAQLEVQENLPGSLELSHCFDFVCIYFDSPPPITCPMHVTTLTHVELALLALYRRVRSS